MQMILLLLLKDTNHVGQPQSYFILAEASSSSLQVVPWLTKSRKEDLKLCFPCVSGPLLSGWLADDHCSGQMGHMLAHQNFLSRDSLRA